MYRLVRFKATNVIGFMSGLGKKTVEIDLSDLQDKSIICVVGENASGKSTFLSLVHPWHVPTNGKNKFIIPGKEGSLIREYHGDDGSIMISKCIYHPKRDGGHSANCYLEHTKPGCEPVELNPNGNISSYQSLLYTYFGITKDYLTFASYTTEVSSIIKMTDTERKNSVGTLVPNTKRFEIAFDIINEKYKNLRNLIRNVSQKILSLRDEDSLSSDFKRLTEEIKQYTEDREERIRKLSKMEGRLKELTRGMDVDEMISRYNRMVISLATYDSEIDKIYKRLMKLYDKLGIDPEEGSITFPDIDKVPSFIMKYEKKLAANESSVTGFQNREKQLRDELHSVEKDISETDSVLYSIQAQDITELEKTRQEYLDRLASLRYTSMKSQFEDMSYDEVVNFSRVVVLIDQMIQALYDEYGDLVSQYFSADDWYQTMERMQGELDMLSGTIVTSTAKRDQLYRQLIEKQQYQKFQEILDQRPKACTIDSCPFISNALKWQDMAGDIAELMKQYKEINISLDAAQKEYQSTEAGMTIHDDAQKLVRYMMDNESLFKKYFGIDSLKTLYKAIANGTWKNLLDIIHLKDIASILSEKELYLQITMQEIPAIDHSIELAKVYGTNRDLLLHQLDRMESTRKLLKDQLSEYRMHLIIGSEQHDWYVSRLTLWREVSDCIERYRELITAQLDTKKEADEQDEKIQVIKDLLSKCKEQKHCIKELDDLIRERNPKREQVKLDLDAVRRLKIEKLEIERDFTVIEVIRSIIAPGKGIRKELINIYMYDICTIANQLLLNTFDGKLYLKEFLITDKEFIIPYIYNGSEGTDIAYASSAQQSTIASAISLAILSKLMDKYGIYTGDEQDGALNPKNKSAFIRILATQMRYVGIVQAFIITQEPRYYSGYNIGLLCFPGAEVDAEDVDVVYV